ncbi:MAG: acyl-CoA thioesterase [Gemmatimonadota bacterium]
MEGYRFTVTVPVRFADLDALGHVNHAAYLSYFEEARSAYYFRLVGGRGVDRLGFVVAEACCRYRAPAFYPARIEIGVRVSEIGGKSFRMEYEARDEETGAVVAEGHTVLVAYDYARRVSVPVPEAVREATEAFEGRRLLRGGA